MVPMDDPHPASAAALIDGAFVCASVLPWPLVRTSWPWGPTEHQLRVELSLDDLVAAMPNDAIIWGGDWNQPLTGNLAGFSRAARASIVSVLDRLSLQVPTAPSQVGVSRSAASTTSLSRSRGPSGPRVALPSSPPFPTTTLTG